MTSQEKAKLLDLAYSVSLLLEFYPNPAEERENFLKEPPLGYTGICEKLRVQDILNNAYGLARNAKELVESIKNG